MACEISHDINNFVANSPEKCTIPHQIVLENGQFHMPFTWIVSKIAYISGKWHVKLNCL